MYKKCVEILNNLERQGKIKIFNFQFPPKEELKLRLKDMLEDEVDEKYYLSNEQLDRIKSSSYTQDQRRIQEKDFCDTLCARDWKDPKCIQVGNLSGGKWDKINESCRRVYSEEGLSPTIHTCQGGNTEPKILIKNATKQGYLEAEDGDGVYISNIDKKRGTVQKGMIQTLKTSPDVGVVVLGNYNPSGYSSGRIVDASGIAPTVMENHGTVTATLVNNQSRVIGGIGEKKSNNNTQYYLQNRIYEDNIAVSVTTSFNPYRKLTPKEYWRLMGFKDEDFEKAAKVNSNAQLYKQAGNSIVVNVLMAIFNNLLKGK